MRWPQSMLSVMVIPRYFVDWTFFKVWLWTCEVNIKKYSFVMLMQSHSHRLTFGDIKFHLSIGFPWGLLARSNNPGLNVYSYTRHSHLQTEDLMLSDRSLIRMRNRNRTGPRTDPWGTLDSTWTGSEAWPSKSTCWVRPESHELIHLWVDPLIPYILICLIDSCVEPCQRP